MLASQIPTKVPLPFANSGTKNAIPTASQIGITAGAASLTDGFPPLTFTPLASGGVPPAGADFNGILNMITAVQQWQSAGGIFKYDSTFSTSIGGYPKGSILMSTSNDTTWLNTVDNNTSNPDATDGSAANWAPLAAYGIAAVAGLTNANVTLTPAQFSKPTIVLSGTLTGNVQIIFPTSAQQWAVVNNTTGAFAVTCKTAAGTGVTVDQGSRLPIFYDGTNIAAQLYGPTPAQGDNSAKLATTAFVQGLDVVSSNVDANVWSKNGTVVSYATGATNTPTNAGVLTHHCATGGTGDGWQIWQNYNANGNIHLWTRQRWGAAWTPWEAVAPLGVNFNGVTAFGVGTIFTRAQVAGKYIYINAAGATAHSLPVANTMQPGEAVLFENYGAGQATFSRQSTDSLANTVLGTSFILNQYESALCVCDSGGTWFIHFFGGATGLAPQTWQNVAGSRSYGATFTNSTGRKIQVSVTGSATGSGGTLSATVAGITVGAPTYAVAGNQATITFDVPAGAQYIVSNPGTGANINAWAEER